ncbi:hypothetical protein [Streptomyces lunaelactis]|uniref:hypothetical protein n=1 Tax=Streptomyces lunaelactis TaxID=1535768 RepID=UPI00131F1CBB|nr:hypothetical protein [Streptomyces lunaelactis]NUK83612.1 hypothetical protein [Streptomyces lunaelactis]
MTPGHRPARLLPISVDVLRFTPDGTEALQVAISRCTVKNRLDAPTEIIVTASQGGDREPGGASKNSAVTA